MKSFFILFWIATVSTLLSPFRSSGAETNAVLNSSFAPVAFLVGTWRGDLPSGTNETKMAIESKYEWTGNHQGIRFDSTWVIGDKRRPYCSGIYLWNPAMQRLEIFYSDAKGSLTEGFVEQTGQTLQHNLKVTDKTGKIEQVQARMTHSDAKSYFNDIYMMADGQWQKLVSVRYERTGWSQL